MDSISSHIFLYFKVLLEPQWIAYHFASSCIIRFCKTLEPYDTHSKPSASAVATATEPLHTHSIPAISAAITATEPLHTQSVPTASAAVIATEPLRTH